MCIYPIGETKACRYAADLLQAHSLTLIDHPSPEVTHLMLDVPSFQNDGQLRCGGYIEPFLRMLPQNIKIIGGNLNTPCLDPYTKIDLLQSEDYLAKNAAITADCAIRLISSQMDAAFPDSPALVIGWGRIGKCLVERLRGLGCPTAIALRNSKDRSILSALGYHTVSIGEIPQLLNRFSLLFNTVPCPVISTPLPADIIAVELASSPGIEDPRVIDGRGLPGKLAPISSGKRIAETILQLIQEEM